MMLHVDGSPAEMDTESIIKDIEKKLKRLIRFQCQLSK